MTTQPQPLHILLLNPIGGAGWGGVERWMLDVCDWLVARGHSVASAAKPASRWAQACRDHGYPTIELKMRGDFHPADLLALRRAYRQHSIDLVLVKMHQCIRMAWAARLLGLRRLPAIVGVLGGILMQRSLRAKLTYRHMADRYVTPSESARDELLRYGYFPPERIRAIPNCVSIPPDDPAARGRIRASLGLGSEPVAIIVSRLHPDKGHRELLDALAALRGELPSLRLVVVGDGVEMANLTAHARRLGLEGRVIFTGFRTDVADLLRAADLFVLPSYHENMPYAVLEAMAAGLPVVATAVGGVPELVVAGQTGLLVPPHDVSKLAEALRRIFADPGLAARMGRAALERTRTHFAMERMLGDFEAFCLEVRHARLATTR